MMTPNCAPSRIHLRQAAEMSPKATTPRRLGRRSNRRHSERHNTCHRMQAPQLFQRAVFQMSWQSAVQMQMSLQAVRIQLCRQNILQMSGQTVPQLGWQTLRIQVSPQRFPRRQTSIHNSPTPVPQFQVASVPVPVLIGVIVVHSTGGWPRQALHLRLRY